MNLKNDLLRTRKERDVLKVAVLSYILGEIDKIDKRQKVDELSIMKKLYESNLEMIKQLEKLEKDTSNIKRENEILESYFSVMLTREEIKVLITENNISSPKDLFSFFNSNYKNRFDSKQLNEIFKGVK